MSVNTVNRLRRKLRYAGVDLGAYCVADAGRRMRKAFMA